MNKKYWWLTAAILWCIAIFLATASPTSTGGSTQALIANIFRLTESQAAFVNLLFRKGVHLTAFGILAVFFYHSFEKRKYLLAWTLTTVYAASDELHQVFLPNRDGTIADVILDSIGAIITLCIIRLIQLIMEKKKRGQRERA